MPSALRVLKLKPGRRFCVVGRLSHEVGWKYQEIVKTLEEKRKARAKEYYEQKKRTKNLKEKASQEAQPRLVEINRQLAELGYA